MNGNNAILSALIADRGGVERGMRVPLVALSYLIPGPFGIVPSIVASERARAGRDGRRPDDAVVTLRRVPDVVDEEEDRARERLKEAGFDVGVERARAERTEAGKVILQSPEEFAAPGARVTITVSEGPPRADAVSGAQETLEELAANVEALKAAVAALAQQIASAGPGGAATAPEPSKAGKGPAPGAAAP